MNPGTRRALLALLLVLVPAGGLTYLGVVSYAEDRGLVAAQLDEQSRAANTVARAVNAELQATLDAVANAFASAPDHRPTRADLRALARRHRLAAYPFRITRSGRLVFPSASPLRKDSPSRPTSPLLARLPRTCPERGFDACVLEIRQARRRASLLEDARKGELTGKRTAWVARTYQRLAAYDDTAPNALLGLARLAKTPQAAAAHYDALAKRFGGQNDPNGVPYQLIAELGQAESAKRSSPALLDLYRRLVRRQYVGPASALAAIVSRLRILLGKARLTPEQTAELHALDDRLDAARVEASFASALANEVEDLARTGVTQPRGRPALASTGTLVYRRQGDHIVGIIIDRTMLERVAASAKADVDLAKLAQGAHVVVDRIGVPRQNSRLRTLASVGFGQILPHLNLAVVNDLSLPDPLDQIIRARGRQHLIITSGLALLLVLGILATIRGAARERELARLKSDFVSTVSHELKTPLTSIRMFAEMLQQDVAGQDRSREQRYHGIIVKESERLGLLIANLLDYSQIERGTRRYTRETERLSELAQEAVTTFQRFREDEPLDLQLHIADEASEAFALVDREVVVQALLNLLANAAKYGGSDQPIEVRVELKDHDRGAIAVRDHGPGIPPGEQSRIFREFYRAPAAYSSGVEGTGLGLALVKRHVEAQGGQVELESKLKAGSTFTLVFPRAS